MKSLSFNELVYFLDPESKTNYVQSKVTINYNAISFIVPSVPKKFLMTLEFLQVDTTKFREQGTTIVMSSGDIFYLTREQITKAEKNFQLNKQSNP